MAAFHQTARSRTLRFRTFRERRWRRKTAICSRPQKWEGDLQVTEQEQEQLLSELKAFLHANNTAKGEKPPKKGLFSKVVVALCILIVIAYTSICLLMHGAHYSTGDLVRKDGVVWEAKKDMKPCVWEPTEGNEWTRRDDK